MNTSVVYGVVRHCDKCGWIRCASNNAEWLKKVIDHPVYGPVTERRLVQLDTLNHDCDAFMTVVSRLQNAEKARYTYNDAA